MRSGFRLTSRLALFIKGSFRNSSHNLLRSSKKRERATVCIEPCIPEQAIFRALHRFA